jgi:outer membrane protein TolC
MVKLQSQLDDARIRLRTIRETMKDADENFLLTKSKYAGGSGLAIEVLSALQMLTDIRLSELQILAEIRLVEAKIDHLLTK